MTMKHTRLAVSAAALALATGLAVEAQAEPSPIPIPGQAPPPLYRVGIADRTLKVTATDVGGDLALRLAAADPSRLQVDVGDDGTADFAIARTRFDRVVVAAGSGDNNVRVDDTNGPLAVPTSLDGGAGGDGLFGGRGDETLIGGEGHDFVDGNGGRDHADLGEGNDTFRWDPGDGSDTIDGQGGSDRLQFIGTDSAERFEIFRTASGATLTRDLGTIRMDLVGVETVDTRAFGGRDRFIANDLTASGVTHLRTELTGSPDDAAADEVVVNGTNGADTLTASGATGTTTVAAVGASLTIVGAHVPEDTLTINGLGGDDVIRGGGLGADAISFIANGGAGNDVLFGGAGIDVLNGDDGDDVLIGGPAFDVLDGGPGTDVVQE